MRTWGIQLWDQSPSLGDMRNPDVLMMKMEVQCSEVQFVFLLNKFRKDYGGQYRQIIAFEKIITCKDVEV